MGSDSQEGRSVMLAALQLERPAMRAPESVRVRLTEDDLNEIESNFVLLYKTRMGSLILSREIWIEENLPRWNRRHWLAPGQPRLVGGHKNIGWGNIGHHSEDCHCDQRVHFQNALFDTGLGRLRGQPGMSPQVYNDVAHFEAMCDAEMWKEGIICVDAQPPKLPDVKAYSYEPPVIGESVMWSISGGEPLSKCRWLGDGVFKPDARPTNAEIAFWDDRLRVAASLAGEKYSGREIRGIKFDGADSSLAAPASEGRKALHFDSQEGFVEIETESDDTQHVFITSTKQERRLNKSELIELYRDRQRKGEYGPRVLKGADANAIQNDQFKRDATAWEYEMEFTDEFFAQLRGDTEGAMQKRHIRNVREAKGVSHDDFDAFMDELDRIGTEDEPEQLVRAYEFTQHALHNGGIYALLPEPKSKNQHYDPLSRIVKLTDVPRQDDPNFAPTFKQAVSDLITYIADPITGKELKKIVADPQTPAGQLNSKQADAFVGLLRRYEIGTGIKFYDLYPRDNAA